jgi:hypothetical protein
MLKKDRQYLFEKCLHVHCQKNLLKIPQIPTQVVYWSVASALLGVVLWMSNTNFNSGQEGIFEVDSVLSNNSQQQ